MGVAMEKVLSPYVFDLKEGRVNLPSLVRKMTSCLSYLNIANTSSWFIGNVCDYQKKNI